MHGDLGREDREPRVNLAEEIVFGIGRAADQLPGVIVPSRSSCVSRNQIASASCQHAGRAAIVEAGVISAPSSNSTLIVPVDWLCSCAMALSWAVVRGCGLSSCGAGVGSHCTSSRDRLIALARADAHIDARRAGQQRHAGLRDPAVQPLHGQRRDVDL